MVHEVGHFFLAVPLPDTVKKILHQYARQLREQLSYKQWPHPQDYHVTLAFLGAADTGKIDEMKQKVSVEVKNCSPFSMSLKGLGTFGKKDQPRVLWAGVDAEQGLFDLQRKVFQACQSAGFKLDTRPYRPHITLAKKWDGERKLDPSILENDVEQLSWEVGDIVLYQTRLHQTPKYESVKFFRLQADKNK